MTTPVHLHLPTAHCGACRREIVTALEAVAGVTAVLVDLVDRTVEVHRDDRRPDRAALVAALVAAGHPPSDRMPPQPGSKPDPTTAVHGAAARSSTPTASTPDLTSIHRSDEDDLP